MCRRRHPVHQHQTVPRPFRLASRGHVGGAEAKRGGGHAEGTVQGKARPRKRERNAMEQLAKSRGPRGMEEHSTRWRVRWSLRHSTRCLRPASYPQPRAESVPDFALLHAKFQRQLAASRQVRHTTTPQPFRLTIKTKSQKSAPVRYFGASNV
uniref:Uncharacterized protein n=1 Tax=Globodera pallida TaxID=36090 RepID=A0A183BII7_GLOPA